MLEIHIVNTAPCSNISAIEDMKEETQFSIFFLKHCDLGLSENVEAIKVNFSSVG